MPPLCIKTLSTCQKHSGHWNHGPDVKEMVFKTRKDLILYIH